MYPLDLSEALETPLQVKNLCIDEDEVKEFLNTGHVFINLKELVLQEVEFIEIPDFVFDYHDLQILDLSFNNIKSLSPEIGRLKNLHVLNLSSNQITLLPGKIENLGQLKTLDMSDNRISSLPREIEKLVLLENLILSMNMLNTIPPQIGKLSNLASLYLNENLLSELPKELGHLRELVELQAEDNKLVDIPEEILQLDIPFVLLCGNLFSQETQKKIRLHWPEAQL